MCKMKIISHKDCGELLISLSGDLDHHAAKVAIPEISRLIELELPTTLILDFSHITFMDSSGIALVIGCFKRAKSIGCTFFVKNVSKQANKVFNAAGIGKIITIEEQEAILTQ